MKDVNYKSIFFRFLKEKRLYEWYKSNGDGTYMIATWDDEINTTWNQLANSKWSDLVYMPEKTTHVKDIYVEYKVGDL